MHRGSRKVAILSLTVCLASGGLILISLPALAASITEFPLPTSAGLLEGITAGPDGNLWFAELGGNKIGQISITGTIAEFPVPGSPGGPHGITTGPDHNLWFAESQGNKIGRISTTGTFAEFPIPTPASFPLGITTGPDHNLWFTEAGGNKVGNITPGGTVTEFPIPTAASQPGDQIATGPNGNLWFAESQGNKIGEISATGTFAEFPVPTPASFPEGITAGPDGNVWFTEFFGNKIGRISSSGIITEFSLPIGSAEPHDITQGPDGNLWFAEACCAAGIGRITTTGTVTEFPVPTPDSCPAGIAAGPDGNLWFTEACSNKIGRLTPVLGDAAISATGTNLTATEGATSSGIVATFTDPDTTATASEYSTAISWGDGTTTTGAVTGSGGSFTVVGTHNYAEEGTFNVTATITDTDNASNAATTRSIANVSDASLSSQCATPPFTQVAFSGSTASFTDQSSSGTPSDFTVSINWGDGSSSAGTITGGPGATPYTVSGSHTYPSTGPFVITTAISDIGGSTTTASCKVVVFAFASSSGAPFVIGDLESAMGSSVTWWSSQWSQLNLMSGGRAPSSMKGFAGFEDNQNSLPPACGGSWTTDTGNAAQPPASAPDFMGVVVSRNTSQSKSVVSGDIKEIVIVKNDPGYAPDPGHPGSGTIVGILCVS